MRNACNFVDSLIMGVHAIYSWIKSEKCISKCKEIWLRLLILLTNRSLISTTILFRIEANFHHRWDDHRYRDEYDDRGWVRFTSLGMLLKLEQLNSVKIQIGWSRLKTGIVNDFDCLEFLQFLPQGNPPFSLLCPEMWKSRHSTLKEQ